jgi:hypothetical protein
VTATVHEQHNKTKTSNLEENKEGKPKGQRQDLNKSFSLKFNKITPK